MYQLSNNSNREIDYLRISVTDRCNLRCVYCMPPDGIETVAQQEVLTFEEMVRLVRILAELGISRIRLTGGDPLVRKGVANLVKSLANVKGIEEVSLTTNGILLPLHARELKDAGLKRINISLDTLSRGKFRTITGSDCLLEVFQGIEEAKKAGFYPLKLNTVVIRGINDDEIIDFVDFALCKGLTLRFIEFINVTPLWEQKHFISAEEVKEICAGKFRMERVNYSDSGPAEYYSAGGDSILGFIKTDLNNCRICSRLRLTSTGELKICLYEDRGLFLKQLLRNGASDREIMDIIKAKLRAKQYADYTNWEPSKTYMYSLGG